MTEQEKIELKLRLESQFKNGVSWFYWIAGLSLINTVVILFDGSWNFIAGLGITQLIDAFAYSLAESFGNNIIYIGLFINLLIIGMYVVFGRLAHKKIKWAIITGMVLYSLDAVLFIIFQDYLAILFHIFAVYSIFRGLKAGSELSKVENITLEAESESEVAVDELTSEN
jgi:hypothetical protein